MKKRYKFYNGDFRRKDLNWGEYYTDKLPRITYYMGKLTTELMDKTRVCENCGAIDNLKMFQVRKLKKLKGRNDWEKVMIARKRKTLAVCCYCYDKIHSKKQTERINGEPDTGRLVRPVRGRVLPNLPQ